jgi:hypothetical protein
MRCELDPASARDAEANDPGAVRDVGSQCAFCRGAEARDDRAADPGDTTSISRPLPPPPAPPAPPRARRRPPPPPPCSSGRLTPMNPSLPASCHSSRSGSWRRARSPAYGGRSAHPAPPRPLRSRAAPASRRSSRRLPRISFSSLDTTASRAPVSTVWPASTRSSVSTPSDGGRSGVPSSSPPATTAVARPGPPRRRRPRAARPCPAIGASSEPGAVSATGSAKRSRTRSRTDRGRIHVDVESVSSHGERPAHTATSRTTRPARPRRSSRPS